MRLGVTDACTIGGNPHGKQAVLRALEASTVSDENEGVLGGRIIALLAADEDILTSSIPKMPPFPEVVPAPAELMRMGFNLCVVSSTDDAIIADNVLQR
jgi:phosphoglycolate phosphatase-like HAD superfamily hydrolase